MHIAHSGIIESIGVEQLAKRTGLKRRQLAYLAKMGKIPGVTRPNGCHYRYPVCAELLDWIDWQRSRVEKRKGPYLKKQRPNRGVVLIQDVRMSFDIWQRHVREVEGVMEMHSSDQGDILNELLPIVTFGEQLYMKLASQAEAEGVSRFLCFRTSVYRIKYVSSSGAEEFLSIEQLAKGTGLKRRQLAYLAKKGKIPGVTRPNGYHYRYPVTIELLDWIEWKHFQVKKKQSGPSGNSMRNRNIAKIRDIGRNFGTWYRRMRGLEGVMKTDHWVQMAILDEILPLIQFGEILYMKLYLPDRNGEEGTPLFDLLSPDVR